MPSHGPIEPPEFDLPEHCPVCKRDNADEDGESLCDDSIHCGEDCARHSKDGSYSWSGVDSASYVGDEQDGCYYSAGHGPNGWYYTVVVDCDSAGFVDTIVSDDGPYNTEDDAKQAGKNQAIDWCLTNHVSYDDKPFWG